MSKEGPNKLRLFHCCALPKVKQCQHFSWADLHHPKVCIILIMSSNNVVFKTVLAFSVSVDA